MNIFKRAILYISRKRRQSLTLLLSLWLVIAALIGGIAVKNAGRATQREFEKERGSKLHIAGNQTDLIGDGYGSGEIPETVMQEIAKHPGVDHVNNSMLVYAGLTAQKMVQRSFDTSQYEEQMLTVYTNTCSQEDAHFTAGMISLKEGRHITADDKHVMMVHEEFAKANQLKVGDKLLLGRDPLRRAADKDTFEVTIVGIFKGKTAQKSDDPYEMLENTVLADEQLGKDLYGYGEGKSLYMQSVLSLKPSADREEVKAFVLAQGIDWNKYGLTEEDPLLTTYAKSIKVLNRLVDSMQDGAVVAAIILVTMALFFWMSGRTHETGILLALGKSKLNIIAQYALEVLLVAILAFGLAFPAGKAIGKKAGDVLVYQASRSVRSEFMQEMGGMNLGADGETDMLMQTVKGIDVQVTPNEIMKVFFLETAVILMSVVGSSLVIVRYKPSEILSKMS